MHRKRLRCAISEIALGPTLRMAKEWPKHLEGHRLISSRASIILLSNEL